MRFSDQVEMDDPYACAICWQRLSQPVVLNCGHTFDRKCIENLEDCPICRSEILIRSTNWQMISMIELKNKNSPPSRDSSSAEVDLEGNYIPIKNWNKLQRGTMIKYTINAKKSAVHYGWFGSFDLERQIVQVQLNRGKIAQLPVEYIKEAWYHPDLTKEIEEKEGLCCTLL